MAVLCSGLCLGATLSTDMAPSHADALLNMPIPYDVSAAEVADVWINTKARAEENPNLGIDLLSITPGPYHPGDPLEAQLRITNNLDTTLNQVEVVPRRGEVSSSMIDTRTALTARLSTFGWIGANNAVADTLQPGEHRDITLTLRSPFGAESEGTYPIAFQATATTSEEESVLNSERSAISVDPASSDSVGEASQSAGTDHISAVPDSSGSNPLESPTPSATLIIPLSASNTLTPGETGEAPNETPLILSSESLADELADGGRLDTLVDALEADPAHRNSRCLAIDPDTLTTIDRMSRGYFVATERDAIVDKQVRLRDRWTQDDKDQVTEEPGRGTDDARRWLDRLKKQAAVTCTVALPWAGADLRAVAKTGDEWLARQTLQEGTAVVKDILGTNPVERVVIPSSGYITQETLPILKWAETPLTQEKVEAAWEKSAKTLAEKKAAKSTDTADSHSGGDAAESEEADRNTNSLTASQSGDTWPTQPVRVVVADNTVWSADITDGESSPLGRGILAYGYDASLAATLATTGTHPLTVGYTNPDTRCDYTQDSTVARDTTAGTVLRQALDAHDELMIMPPSILSGSTGTMLISTVGQMIDRGEVTAQPLKEYLEGGTAPTLDSSSRATPLSEQDSAATAESLSTEGKKPGLTADGKPGYGAPFPDPTMLSDGEVVNATKQANYVDQLTRLLSNDPNIALRRYAFTAPLRRDIVRFLAPGKRASYLDHDAWTDYVDEQLNYSRTILSNLRASVALIPPGNVYTLTSPSSPLLVVAENRLPLPVVAKVGYQGAEGLKLKLPRSIRIPAAGSITTEVTAELPQGQTSTELSLWLATRDNAVISQPVTVSVQTRPLVLGIIFALVLGVGATVIAVVLGKRRKAS